MRDVVRVCFFAVASAIASVSVPARAGDADEKTQCISSSDEGQQLRDDGKYKLARDAFARCSRATCPGLVRQECAQWLIDLDVKFPTVVVDAKDDRGNDLVDVTVKVDGVDLVGKLDGLPLAVDGGEHVFRYEAPGFEPIEDHIVVRAGEKNRVLPVRFVPMSGGPPPSAGPAGPISHPKGPPLAAWILGGVSVAAFASETYFGLAGLGKYNGDTGAGGCAGHCPASEKSSIQTQFAIADVSLGIGIVSAGLAAYFFLRPREPAPIPAAAIDLAPRTGGGVASISARF